MLRATTMTRKRMTRSRSQRRLLVMLMRLRHAPGGNPADEKVLLMRLINLPILTLFVGTQTVDLYNPTHQALYTPL
jgi:hypothetical protein